MNVGFDLVSEGAKPKRAVEDAPTQAPMRPEKLRRNPDSDQKAARRRLKQKTAVDADRKGHSVTCPQCGATDLETRVWPDHSRLDAYCKNCGWRGTKTKKESNVNFNQREAELLSAMGKATLAEQRVLAAELEEVRAQRTTAVQDERDVDISVGVIRDHLTPVLTHSLNTTATDWLGEMDEDDIDVEGAVRIARAEAGAWFERTSTEVRADRDEFAEQAMGKARVCASRFGSAADPAQRAFLDTVSFLHKRADVVPFTDSASGPQNPNVQPWNQGSTTGDSNTDASSQKEVGVTGEGADPDQNMTASLHTAAGDSPGKVDQEQSGNAESTITDYDTFGNDAGTFDEKQTGDLAETGPWEVPSTRAPNVTGSRELRTIAWDVVRDWDDIDRSAAPYLAAMTAMGSIDQSYGDTPGQEVVAYFLRNSGAWDGERSAELRAELGSMLDPIHAKVASPEKPNLEAMPDSGQSGEAVSHDKQVEVGNPNDRQSMWPWELAELPPGMNGSAPASGAASVDGVHTPGQSVADYPQPHHGAGLDNLGDNKAPPFGKKDGDEDDDDDQKMASLENEATYHYIKQVGDKWVIWQKGTGKTLSTHDSKEQAESAFRGMEQHMHGGSLIDQNKLAAFRERVAASIGGDSPFERTASGYEGNEVGHFKAGDRVETHPGTNSWMMGDRYGDVVKTGREKVHVKLDRSGRTIPFHPTRIRHVD